MPWPVHCAVGWWPRTPRQWKKWAELPDDCSYPTTITELELVVVGERVVVVVVAVGAAVVAVVWDG